MNLILLVMDDFEVPGPGLVPPAPTDAKTLERLSERSYVRDWYRLGLCSTMSANCSSRQNTEPFRISTVNSRYTLCHRFVINMIVTNYFVLGKLILLRRFSKNVLLSIIYICKYALHYISSLYKQLKFYTNFYYFIAPVTTTISYFNFMFLIFLDTMK